MPLTTIGDHAMIWECQLCEATSAGTAVTHRASTQICDWCMAELARTGRAWCTRGRHVVGALTPHKARRWCHACKAEDQRARYARNPGTRTAPPRTPAQRDRQRVINQRYAARNRARIRARQRAYYWRVSRLRCIAATRARRAANPERTALLQRQSKQRAKVRLFRRLFAR